ncbi:hypothetical protein EG19_02030 [Thermoanaerobaculum aquaticum]|uniref:Glycosyltransferase RgtA/B/C/D-like domain-containing protein n=2 Tax=Thermoanaerobaculum aquaticum TaxID=1312852 RepID=A0A062XZR3_9BACT|nr:hypothetical protein EG19_02030 [Thermoanaerobaculum aquaticum]
MIAQQGPAVASGADNSGYMNLARLFLAGKIRDELRVPEGFSAGQLRPWLFTPLGFQPDAAGKSLVPVYPPGLPLQQAVWAWFLGSVEKGAAAVNVFCGVLFLWLCYRLARLLALSRTAAGIAALILAVNPVSLRFFTWNMSDGPAATWAVAAVYFALRAQKKPSFAALGGFFFALGVATRPTNALLLPAIVYALWRRPKAQKAFVLGAAPLLAAFFWYNHVQYGAFWRTGYGSMAREFKLRYFLPTVRHYGLWLARFFSPLVLLPFLSHLLALRRRETRHLLLALWWVPFFGFYAFYKYTNDTWWYLRFVLPAFPALVLAGVAAFPELSRYVKERLRLRRVFVLPTLFVLLALGANLFWLNKLRVLALTKDEAIYREGVQWVCRETPEKSLLFASQLSGAFYFYSSRAIVRHDLITSRELSEVFGQSDLLGLPAFMALLNDEAQTFVRRNPGLVEPSGNFGRVYLFRVRQGAAEAVGKTVSSPPSRRPSVVPDAKKP